LLRETDVRGKRIKRRKFRFITDYEPSFTNIREVLKQHEGILKNDNFLAKVFPNGAKDFQVTERRGAYNIKELLAPSKMNINLNIEENCGSKPCGKDCAYCPILNRSRSAIFTSVKTGKSFKVRQEINCESLHVVYLITCLRHNFQGVGRATSIKNRFSNYRSHHNKGVRSCCITEHFLDSDHDFENDFRFQPIVKLTNTALIVPECRKMKNFLRTK